MALILNTPNPQLLGVREQTTTTTSLGLTDIGATVYGGADRALGARRSTISHRTNSSAWVVPCPRPTGEYEQLEMKLIYVLDRR